MKITLDLIRLLQEGGGPLTLAFALGLWTFNRRSEAVTQ
jgi:hypothetical protein